jgi:hypothetical protein
MVKTSTEPIKQTTIALTKKKVFSDCSGSDWFLSQMPDYFSIHISAIAQTQNEFDTLDSKQLF